jgi:hypothetical protein
VLLGGSILMFFVGLARKLPALKNNEWLQAELKGEIFFSF